MATCESVKVTFFAHCHIPCWLLTLVVSPTITKTNVSNNKNASLLSKSQILYESKAKQKKWICSNFRVDFSDFYHDHLDDFRFSSWVYWDSILKCKYCPGSPLQHRGLSPYTWDGVKMHLFCREVNLMSSCMKILLGSPNKTNLWLRSKVCDLPQQPRFTLLFFIWRKPWLWDLHQSQ